MTTSAHHDEDSHEVPAHVHHSKKLLKACKTAQLIQNLSAPKTASIQKFALLLLRNSASIARQISYMVHGTSVHGTSTWSISKTFPPPKPRRFRNSACSCSATPRAQLAKFPTWYTVHRYMVHLPGPLHISKPFSSQNRVDSKIRLAPASQLRERSSPNFLHGTRYMVHGT